MHARTLLAASAAFLALSGAVHAQMHDPATPIAVASKVALRGEANNIAVREVEPERRSVEICLLVFA